MQCRAITADDFITEIQFLQSRATHYWRKAVEKLEKLEKFVFYLTCCLISAGDCSLCVVVIMLHSVQCVSRNTPLLFLCITVRNQPLYFWYSTYIIHWKIIIVPISPTNCCHTLPWKVQKS